MPSHGYGPALWVFLCQIRAKNVDGCDSKMPKGSTYERLIGHEEELPYGNGLWVCDSLSCMLLKSYSYLHKLVWKILILADALHSNTWWYLIIYYEMFYKNDASCTNIVSLIYIAKLQNIMPCICILTELLRYYVILQYFVIFQYYAIFQYDMIFQYYAIFQCYAIFQYNLIFQYKVIFQYYAIFQYNLIFQYKVIFQYYAILWYYEIFQNYVSARWKNIRESFITIEESWFEKKSIPTYCQFHARAAPYGNWLCCHQKAHLIPLKATETYANSVQDTDFLAVKNLSRIKSLALGFYSIQRRAILVVHLTRQ